MGPITAEGCAAIATALPVLLLAGLMSDWSLRRLRSTKVTDLRVVAILWMVIGLTMTFFCLYGAATGQGIEGDTTSFWIVLAIVMAYIPGMAAVRLYERPDKQGEEDDAERD